MVLQFEKSDGQTRLSDNFRVREFACKCSRCNEVLVDEVLVDWLQKLRDHFGVPVNINSGYRCEPHNTEVGGSSQSHHLRGMAADIQVEGVAPETVAIYAESIGIQRVGLYDSFVHIGSGTKKRFWLGHEGTNVNTFVQEKEKTMTVTLPVLKRGRKGEEVRALQAHLLGYGYSVGASGLDGSFGAATEAAVRQYQADHQLSVDGSAGPQTRKHMLGVL